MTSTHKLTYPSDANVKMTYVQPEVGFPFDTNPYISVDGSADYNDISLNPVVVTLNGLSYFTTRSAIESAISGSSSVPPPVGLANSSSIVIPVVTDEIQAILDGVTGYKVVTPLAVAVNASTGDDTIETGGGDDSIQAGAGNNVVHTNDGDDSVLAGDGDDSIDGGSGDDRLRGEDGNDSLTGGDGKDLLEGGNGNDVLNGGAGNDQLKGGKGKDQLSGGAGDDKLVGQGGNDSLDGGDGDDVLNAGGGKDVLDGGAGNDKLKGGKGDDQLSGGAGADKLTGDEGADTFIFVSGTGSDTVSDFNAADGDLLDFSDFGFASKSAALAAGKQEGNDVVFTLDSVAGDQVTLIGVQLDGLDDTAFV